jgi:hypothetical protein
MVDHVHIIAPTRDGGVTSRPHGKVAVDKSESLMLYVS